MERTGPSKTIRCGVTSRNVNSAMGSGALGPRGHSHLLRLREHVLDGADHVEGLLRDVVAFPGDDPLEGPDGVLQLHVLARRAGERLGDEEWLREETLD